MTMIIPLHIIEIDDGCQFIVKAIINGFTAMMIVDTGSSRTVIDRQSLKDYIDMPKTEKIFGAAVGIGGSDLEQEAVTLDSFRLGDVELTNMDTMAIDLSHLRAFNKQRGLPDFVGIIGGDVLRRLKATINYGRLTITVRKVK